MRSRIIKCMFLVLGATGVRPLWAQIPAQVFVPDTQQVADADGFTLVRDAVVFEFGKGRFFKTVPYEGRSWGVLFDGDVVMRCTPTTVIEREQLQRRFGDTTYVKTGRAAFLYFADETGLELTRKLTFRRGTISHGAKAAYENVMAGSMLYGTITKAFLDRANNSTFYADVRSGESEAAVYMFNPYEVEEVAVYRYFKKLGGLRAESVTRFHRTEDYGLGLDLSYENKDPMVVDSFIIRMTLTDKLEASGYCEIIGTLTDTAQLWVHLLLTSLATVDSVFWCGDKVRCYHAGSDYLWISRPDGAVSSAVRLRVHYHGVLVKRTEDIIYLTDELLWYPRLASNAKSYYDIGVSVPIKYQFASIGQEVESRTEGKMYTGRWITLFPVRNASFNVGFFQTIDIRDPRIIPIKILASEVYHWGVGGSVEKDVGADIANSVVFFQNLFGPIPFSSLVVSESPVVHGMAFPGLIHLGWVTFQGNSESGWHELLRSHEVAHQWWGIGVDFRTYHDQWLSEAFAEYSALLYVQQAFGNNDKFFELLREARDEIVKNREGLLSKTPEAGPIWLGYRTSTTDTPNDYGLIIYRKGAWVLHMLRNMMLDLKTMSDDRFFHMMQRYYTLYNGKAASTSDFQLVVEEAMGGDMDWFFSQWVYGTAVPKYEFATSVKETEDGKFRVSLKVRQTNVPDRFQMPVPIHVDFGGDRYAAFRALVKGRDNAFDLPPLPLKPKKITFNALESVLCEVEEKPWNHL